ncbi:MAG: hypothetical protein MRY23_06250 [Pelagibacteraceae bacterium]|nr:hypothetical protein [Pelagibacteraceae bacterium]MCI5078821.1 hypothetical protein [Pelagibacteraceae bacterium]
MNFSIIDLNNKISPNDLVDFSKKNGCQIFNWASEHYKEIDADIYDKSFLNKLTELKNFVKYNKPDFFLVISTGDKILQKSLDIPLANEFSEKVIFLRHAYEIILKDKYSKEIEFNYPINKDLNSIFKCIFSGNLPNFFIHRISLLKFINTLEKKNITIYPGIFDLKNLISFYVLYKNKNFLISKKKFFYSKIYVNNKTLIISKKLIRPIEELIKNPYWSISLKNFQSVFNLNIKNYYQYFFDAIITQEFKVGLKKNFKLSGFDKIIINFMFRLYKLKKFYFLNLK